MPKRAHVLLGPMLACAPPTVLEADDASEGGTGGVVAGSSEDVTSSGPTSAGMPVMTLGQGGASTSEGTSGGFGSTEEGDSDCDVPVDYETIQSAIDDTTCTRIYIDPANYNENLTIDRDVELYGRGAAVRLFGDPEERLVTVKSGTVKMVDFEMVGDGLPSQGAIENSGDLTLMHVRIEEWKRYGGEGTAIRSNGPLALVDCRLSDNDLHTVHEDGGPQVVMGGSIYVDSAPLTLNSTFIGLSGVLLTVDSEARGGANRCRRDRRGDHRQHCWWGDRGERSGIHASARSPRIHRRRVTPRRGLCAGRVEPSVWAGQLARRSGLRARFEHPHRGRQSARRDRKQ